MNRSIILLVLAAVFVIASGSMANAQSQTRIQFDKGKSSAVVSGNTGAHGKMYVLRARSGQKLIIDVSPRKGVGVKVETIGRFGHAVLLRQERGGYYEIGLEETGDYTIFLGSTSGRPASFRFTVKITKLSDI